MIMFSFIYFFFSLRSFSDLVERVKIVMRVRLHGDNDDGIYCYEKKMFKNKKNT